MFPFRRAYRSIFRKKRPAKKRAKAMKRGRTNVRNGLVHVKKTIIDPRVLVNANGTVFNSDTFELSDLPQYTNYTALYEEYRIDKIVYSFKALNNVAPTGLATAATTFHSLGMVHSIVDLNDAVAPVSIQTMMNDSSYKGNRSNVNHTRTFVPKWLNNVGGAAAAQSKTGWLNTDFPGVSHYSLKWAFEGGTASAPGLSYIIEPIVTYYVSFRNPK